MDMHAHTIKLKQFLFILDKLLYICGKIMRLGWRKMHIASYSALLFHQSALLMYPVILGLMTTLRTQQAVLVNNKIQPL